MANPLARAYGYPYSRPVESFLYGVGGPGTHVDLNPKVREHSTAQAVLDSTEILHSRLPISHRRTAVLAIGSNGSPEQLGRKYSSMSGKDGVIPVLAVELRGYDVVYSALITSYGSICATLVPADKDTCVLLHVTMLTRDQLEVMHGTEGGYDFRRLPLTAGALRLRVSPCSAGKAQWAWPSHVPVFVYLCSYGALAVNKSPVALSEIPAYGRRLRQLEQARMQRQVLDIVCDVSENDIACCGRLVDNFVQENVMDNSLRAKRNKILRNRAVHAWNYCTRCGRNVDQCCTNRGS